MTITTVTTRGKPKPFAWSYSKLKNYEDCPKRYYNIDVAKNYKENDEAGHLGWGNAVHKALAAAVANGTPLPDSMKAYREWPAKLRATPGEFLVEQQMAITEQLGPAEWFGNDAWYRGIADVIKKVGPVALVVDWKTGKILEDGIQLALMAQCVFAHHPEIQKIRTEFIWLKEDATTRADFTRADMAAVWAGLLPRVTTLKRAHETMEFPPKPGGLCRRFCIVESCPHKGE